MTQEEILNYNRMCAEFLQLEIIPTVSKEPIFIYKEYQYYLHKLKFHSDWNWIMEILKHIREIINVELTIHDFVCVKEMGLTLNPYDYSKEQVTQAINQFLIWYNNEQRT